MFRRRRDQQRTEGEQAAPADPVAVVDPEAVPARYRAAVHDALAARARFASVRDGVRPGPTRERLEGLGARVDAGVLGVWRVVTRASEVESVVAGLEPDRVTAEYKAAKRDGSPPEVVEALAGRFASVQRLLNSVDDLDGRLQLLDARLGEAVARAAEVALVAGDDAAALDQVERDLQAVSDDLTALTQGLDAVG